VTNGCKVICEKPQKWDQTWLERRNMKMWLKYGVMHIIWKLLSHRFRICHPFPHKLHWEAARGPKPQNLDSPDCLKRWQTLDAHCSQLFDWKSDFLSQVSSGESREHSQRVSWTSESLLPRTCENCKFSKLGFTLTRDSSKLFDWIFQDHNRAPLGPSFLWCCVKKVLKSRQPSRSYSAKCKLG